VVYARRGRQARLIWCHDAAQMRNDISAIGVQQRYAPFCVSIQALRHGSPGEAFPPLDIDIVLFHTVGSFVTYVAKTGIQEGGRQPPSFPAESRIVEANARPFTHMLPPTAFVYHGRATTCADPVHAMPHCARQPPPSYFCRHR